MKNNSLDETPQPNPPLTCLSPLYTDSSIRTEWVRMDCCNSYKKQPWLLRNAVFSRAWDRVRGLYFDWRLKMSRSAEKNTNSTVRMMSTDIRPPNDDRQLSIYELLYVNQCQAVSGLVEKMVTDGNMTDEQLEYIQKHLLGGLSDRAKASLVIRALYGNRKTQFGG